MIICCTEKTKEVLQLYGTTVKDLNHFIALNKSDLISNKRKALFATLIPIISITILFSISILISIVILRFNRRRINIIERNELENEMLEKENSENEMLEKENSENEMLEKENSENEMLEKENSENERKINTIKSNELKNENLKNDILNFWDKKIFHMLSSPKEFAEQCNINTSSEIFKHLQKITELQDDDNMPEKREEVMKEAKKFFDNPEQVKHEIEESNLKVQKAINESLIKFIKSDEYINEENKNNIEKILCIIEEIKLENLYPLENNKNENIQEFSEEISKINKNRKELDEHINERGVKMIDILKIFFKEKINTFKEKINDSVEEEKINDLVEEEIEVENPKKIRLLIIFSTCNGIVSILFIVSGVFFVLTLINKIEEKKNINQTEKESKKQNINKKLIIAIVVTIILSILVVIFSVINVVFLKY